MQTPTQDDRQQAQEALAYIRQTMESASSFTALSGWGLVAVGFVGLGAAFLAWRSGVPERLVAWLPAAVIGVLASGVANTLKAQRLEMPLWTGSLRKVAWVMTPALVAGALMTWALDQAGARFLMPGTWLALYGAGVTAGGTFSIRAVRWMGLAMLLLGALAFVNQVNAILYLAVGFGVLHILFGLYIVRRHGG